MRFPALKLLAFASLAVSTPVWSQPVYAPAAVVFARHDTLTQPNAHTALSVQPAKRKSPIIRGLVIGAIAGAAVGMAAMQTAGVGCDTTAKIRPDGSLEDSKCYTLRTRIGLLAYGAGVGGVLGGATGAVIGGVVRLTRPARE